VALPFNQIGQAGTLAYWLYRAAPGKRLTMEAYRVDRSPQLLLDIKLKR
jgi:hypothetical protein